MSKSVLVVEDEDSIALALDFLLRRRGYMLDRVKSGEDALKSIHEAAPDLILLDVMLPGCSGYEVCRSVRSDPACKDVKILMMTAKGGQIEQRKCLSMGADAFVAKPFSTVHLTDTVDRLLCGEPA